MIWALKAIKKKDMRQILLRTYNKFIIFLLGTIGFSVGCMKAEYGTPSADFILNGNIQSVTTEQPIKNIKVSMGYETVNSDENGDFTIKINNFPQEQTFNVLIEDIDSTENGSFQDKDTTVTFPDGNFSGGDGWYEGETKKNITIRLDEK